MKWLKLITSSVKRLKTLEKSKWCTQNGSKPKKEVKRRKNKHFGWKNYTNELKLYHKYSQVTPKMVFEMISLIVWALSVFSASSFQHTRTFKLHIHIIYRETSWHLTPMASPSQRLIKFELSLNPSYLMQLTLFG